jgi:putative ABC transport system ATP-binding protein
METPIISLTGVSKRYSLESGDVSALDNVTLDIRKGEFVAIMGPSGSGKSTLMNQIGILDVPTEGRLAIAGRDIATLTDLERTALRRDTIGFIFQKFYLLPLLTAFENVEYPYILKNGIRDSGGLSRKLLDMVGITERLAAHRPSQLSGGQQQRVAIARALVNDPEILLCDEPTGNLDSRTGTQVMDLLTDLNRKGRTIIVVTHETSVSGYADRTIHIVDGTIQ